MQSKQSNIYYYIILYQKPYTHTNMLNPSYVIHSYITCIIVYTTSNDAHKWIENHTTRDFSHFYLIHGYLRFSINLTCLRRFIMCFGTRK